MRTSRFTSGILNVLKKIKGRPAPGYKITPQGNFANRDKGLDRDAQALSFKVFGMMIPFISGSPPDNQ
jgi:hypothetical protein